MATHIQSDTCIGNWTLNDVSDKVINCIKSAIKNLCSNIEYGLCSLKVTESDAHLPQSFSHAIIEFKTNDEEEQWKHFYKDYADTHTKEEIGKMIDARTELVPLGNLFATDLILDALERKSLDKLYYNQIVALKRLCDFVGMSDKKKKEIYSWSMKCKKEVEWAAYVLIHILKMLAVSQYSLIDKHFGFKKQLLPNKNDNDDDDDDDDDDKVYLCPCKCTEVLFGDTSFGNASVWHGSTDIFVGKTRQPISIGLDIKETTPMDDSKKWDMGCETKARDIGNVSQHLSSTVTFSCCYTEEKLVPSIVVAPSVLQVFMYDSEFDFLLQSTALDMFEKAPHRIPKIESILAIWFCLNYRFFCDGITENLLKLNYTSDIFINMPEKKRKIYESDNDMSFGKRHKVYRKKSDKFVPISSKHVLSKMTRPVRGRKRKAPDCD